MGLILDTSILIANERSGRSVEQLIEHLIAIHRETEAAISAVSVVELTHGIYRAKSERDRERRLAYCEELFRDLIVHPVSFEIAQLAGKIEGQQAALGNTIDFEDLLIGSTALHFGFEVASLNVKHFKAIPGLAVVSLAW